MQEPPAPPGRKQTSSVGDVDGTCVCSRNAPLGCRRIRWGRGQGYSQVRRRPVVPLKEKLGRAAARHGDVVEVVAIGVEFGQTVVEGTSGANVPTPVVGTRVACGFDPQRCRSARAFGQWPQRTRSASVPSPRSSPGKASEALTILIPAAWIWLLGGLQIDGVLDAVEALGAAPGAIWMDDSATDVPWFVSFGTSTVVADNSSVLAGRLPGVDFGMQGHRSRRRRRRPDAGAGVPAVCHVDAPEATTPWLTPRIGDRAFERPAHALTPGAAASHSRVRVGTLADHHIRHPAGAG